MDENQKTIKEEFNDQELLSNIDDQSNDEEYIESEANETAHTIDNEKANLDDTIFDTIAIEIYEENILVKLLGSLVAGLGLFLFGSKTSGLVSQISGYVIFIIGVLIVTS